MSTSVLPINLMKQRESTKMLKNKWNSSKKEVSKEQQAFRDGQTKLYQGYRYIENLKSKKRNAGGDERRLPGFFPWRKSSAAGKSKGTVATDLWCYH
ncbi:hypothetical protein RWE15_20885 [Virgibacillus halophilus]|uniref:Uncharacterized protein n=1 Tax=Tigheibacillus halophilus TaxID=361280 RepID=A0ABU5CCG8_9BACI|nr:hypothetical protein [Virgibacillus halophilus]